MADTDQTTRPISILLVEDDPITGMVFVRLLNKLGYKPVGPAQDAASALTLAEAEEPELALVDVALPDVASGLALGRDLLEAGVAVVFVTGHRDEEILAKVAAIGPYGLVFKPVDHFQLAVSLEGVLRRRAEERLAHSCRVLSESERRFRAVFEQAGVGVCLITPGRRYLEVNERFARMVGRPALELVGLAVDDLTHPDDREPDHLALARLVAGETESLAWEKRYLRPDGSSVWCRVNVAMLRAADGRPEGLLTVAEDITDRRRAEAELHTQLAFQQSLMDAAVNPIYVQDPQGHYVSINKAFATFLGVTIESALGLTAGEIFSEEIGEMLAAKDREILARGGVQQLEVVLENASGRERDLVFHRARFDDAEGRPQGIVGVATDVTDSKRVEKDLRDEQEVLRRILAGIKAGIFIIDPKTKRLVDVNPMAEELCGRPREELVGRPCSAICWSDADGRPFGHCPLAERNIINMEMRLTRPDGRVVPIIKTVITAKQRGQMRLFEIAFDITERKALERQLAIAQKLESVGELAAGIAHEINTPTQYIGDNLHFLTGAFSSMGEVLTRLEAVAARLAETAGDEAASREIQEIKLAADLDFLLDEVPRALEQSTEGVARVTAIVSAMKRFSHPGGEEKTAVDLNAAVENTVTVARNEWKYVADVALDLDRTLPPVLCLPGDFNQVILNILVNAAHAIGEKVKGTTEKGVITIRTEADGAFCRLSVSDTGAGISEENRRKIFDPFFTTKEVGKGTGQGLAITHNIVVVKHGGSIDFDSELGKGTTFVVRVPFSAAEGPAEATEVPA
jgi:PAS domain S-box-containing protein